MSAQLISASGPGGNNGSPQGTTVGGSKPLHRFIKGQPKIIGIVVLVIGASFFIVSAAITGDLYNQHIWTAIPPGFVLGTLFIVSGILYILTEHNPTKKTVTISLAFSIVSILTACWTILHILPDIGHYHSYRSYEFVEDNMTEMETWASNYEEMGITLETVFLFYSFAGAIIFIVMSVLATAALRSTKSQAIVVMTAISTETPAE